MTTLNLQKKHKGIYEIETDEFLISVSNPRSSNGFGSTEWQLVIIDKINHEDLLDEWFPTKKEASEFGARWVIRNL